jgi:sugar phosphate permease
MTGSLDRTGLVTCCAPPVIISVDFAVVSVLAPAMRSDLGLSGAELAWILSGYSLGYGVLLIAAGRWADVHGPRRALVLGLSVFGAAAATVSLADSAETAIAARVVQGVGAAVMLPAGLSLLTTAVEPRATASYGLALAVGFVTGTLASGLLATAGSWRLGMAVTVPGCLAAAAAASRLPSPGGVPLHRGVGAAAAIGVGCLVGAGGAASGLAGLPGIVLPLAATAVLLVFAARLGHAATGRRRPVAVACAAGAAITGTGVAAILLLTLFLQEERGCSPLEAGGLFATFGAAAVPGAWVARRGAARRLLSLGLAVQGAALLAAVTAADVAVVACLAGFGFGHVLGNAATVSLATVGAPTAVHGALTGTLGAAQRLGGAVGPLLVARVAADEHAFAHGMAATGAGALAAAGLVWIALRDVRP